MLKDGSHFLANDRTYQLTVHYRKGQNIKIRQLEMFPVCYDMLDTAGLGMYRSMITTYERPILARVSDKSWSSHLEITSTPHWNDNMPKVLVTAFHLSVILVDTFTLFFSRIQDLNNLCCMSFTSRQTKTGLAQIFAEEAFANKPRQSVFSARMNLRWSNPNRRSTSGKFLGPQPILENKTLDKNFSWKASWAESARRCTSIAAT